MATKAKKNKTTKIEKGIEEDLLEWMKRKAPKLLKKYTVAQFGKLVEELQGVEAFVAARRLHKQGWPADMSLVMVLGGQLTYEGAK